MGRIYWWFAFSPFAHFGIFQIYCNEQWITYSEKKHREDFNQKKIHNLQLAHVLFSKGEGMRGDGKRKRRAGLRKALQGAGSQALSSPGGISLDLSHGFCHSSAGGSVLACLGSHLRLSHWTASQLSAERVKTTSVTEGDGDSGGSPTSLLGCEGFSRGPPVFPASLRAMVSQEDPPPLSWGVKGSPGARQSFSLGCGEGLRTGAPLRT